MKLSDVFVLREAEESKGTGDRCKACVGTGWNYEGTGPCPTCKGSKKAITPPKE